MEFVYRLKDSVVQYLSPPSKRRRTTGPGSPSNDMREQPLLVPTSEPRNRKAQAAVRIHVNRKFLSPSNTKNPRKRTRVEYEDDEETISPDDSISQVTPQGDDSEEEGSEGGADLNADVEMESDVEGEEEDNEVDEDGSEVTADSNEPDVAMMSEEGGSEGEADSDAVTDPGLELESGEEMDGDEEEGEEEGGEDAVTHQHSNIGAAEEEIEEEEEEVEVDEEAAAEAKVQEYLARQAELALIREEVEKVKAAGDWHADEIYLFERLSMRSYEEVISSEWRIDLPTLPEGLFTTDPEKIFIKNNCNSSYSGVKALQRLLVLGYRVRDLLCNPGRRPEILITREVKSYIRWAERDGDYVKRRFIPVLTFVSAKPGQTTDSLSNSITNEMMFLAQKHRENLVISPGQTDAVKYRRRPPLLYGIIVAQSIVIFVTLDSANPEAKVRHLTHFDFTDKRMVVWNGFAIAYIITMAKDYIISIRDDLEIDDTPDSDPDA